MKTNQKQIMVAISIVILFLIGIIIGYSLNSHTKNNTNLVTPTPEQKESIRPTEKASITPQSSVSPTVIQEPNIKVTAPGENAKVGSSFVVSGEARVFENTFQIRLSNPLNQKVLFTDTVTANAPDVGQFGGFSKEVSFDPTNLNIGNKVLLEVFQNSPKDGAEIDKVSIHLIYEKE